MMQSPANLENYYSPHLQQRIDEYRLYEQSMRMKQQQQMYQVAPNAP